MESWHSNLHRTPVNERKRFPLAFLPLIRFKTKKMTVTRAVTNLQILTVTNVDKTHRKFREAKPDRITKTFEKSITKRNIESSNFSHTKKQLFFNFNAVYLMQLLFALSALLRRYIIAHEAFADVISTSVGLYLNRMTLIA